MNKELAGILKKNNGNDRGLIAVLEKIQAKYGFLTEEALMAVADQTGRSLVDVYGVATFYRAFTLRPRGKHVVRACLGTACHVRGGPAIVQELDPRHQRSAPFSRMPETASMRYRSTPTGACSPSR